MFNCSTGHNIVPATIAPGTTFYHGRADNEIPTSQEWLATDVDHSFEFCRNGDETATEGWMITFMTTRPLKVLYFDGDSAAKMTGGPLDSQDALITGSVRDDRDIPERDRLARLCDWAVPLGLDGFVR